MTDHVLIIADIEGSSGCWSRAAALYRTTAWAEACVEMSRDINAVVRTLAEAGVRHIRVKDFHRTAYNLLPELIDPQAEIIHGYRRRPVAGLGEPGPPAALLMLGLHAASDTPGFLAHTLTSRIRRLTVNGEVWPELPFFAGLLGPYGHRPVFFSGCPVACAQAETFVPGIGCWALDKSAGPGSVDLVRWRRDLAAAAVRALDDNEIPPLVIPGPFRSEVAWRAGRRAAARLARRWRLPVEEDRLFVEASDLPDLFRQLIRICYLTPLAEKVLPLSLALFNLRGRLGLRWVRRQEHTST
ncbi:MAG: M55 family metallopeptidase [Acidobacteria bacterium]|nr:M55 family metallopeptidase [Acidobacteriota bacterium]